MPLPLARLTAGLLAAALVPGGVLLFGAGAAGAADADLGTAAAFAVLAGSTVTNTGATVVTGDLGLSPGTAVTGFPPGTVVGATHVADAVALQAKNDARTAYGVAAALPVTQSVAADLGGRTLTPGVYAGTTLSLTGTLSLDAGGDPAAVFVLRSASTLTTASASRVLLLNGASACNVTWVVGSSVTLGTSTSFVGTVLASTSITATTSATVQGRLLADTGAVTLDTNAVSRPSCTTAVTPTAAPSAVPSASSSPAPSSSGSPTPAATPSTSPSPSTTPSVAVPVVSASPSPSAPGVPAPGPVSGAGGGAVPGPSATPPTTSTGTSVTPSGPAVAQLPRTGTSTATTAAWGALLALVGAALVLAASQPTRGRHGAARRPRHAAPAAS